MVSLDECIGMSGLSEDELDIVARHERVPAMVATELASTLLQSPRGVYRLHLMFRDCITAAAERNDRVREREVSRVYAEFRTRYPTPRQI